MADPIPLGPDDYRQLYGLLTADDPAIQQQGQQLAAKLTPAEQKEFFAFQQQATKGRGEVGRLDATIGGVPPELAVTGGIGLGRAVARAAAPGLSMAARAGAAAKGVASQAAPIVKYELIKTSLEHLGVPSPLAITAAMTVSGYRRGATAEAPAAAAETPPPAPPAAPGPTIWKGGKSLDEAVADAVSEGRLRVKPPAPSAAPEVSAASAAPSPTANAAAAAEAPPSNVVQMPKAMSPQRLLNEVAIAQRRAGVKLTAAEEGQALDLMRQGTPAADAVKAVKPPAPVAAAKPNLSAAQVKEYLRLVKGGMSSKDAYAAVRAASQFNQDFGLKTPTAAQTQFPKGWGPP